jgi:HlyD family secretion protein
MRKRNCCLMLCCCLISALWISSVAAQGTTAKDPGETATQTKPSTNGQPAPSETHTVETSPFKIEVTLEGVFEAAEMVPVTLRPEVWSSLVVVKAVEQGTSVKQGEPIIWLETKKIDEQLRDLRYSRDLARIALRQAEESLNHLKETAPLDLAQAERAKQIADDDLSYFLDVDLPLRKKSAERSLDQAHFNLEYTQEELNQLEKMYRADDLTEETEEIILKRARRSVETAQFFLESAKIRTKRTLETELPRQEEQVKESAVRQSFALQKIQATQPMQIRQKELELEKLQYERQKSDENYEKLQQDRDSLTIRAPADGIVYYGECVRGKWNNGGTMAKQLQKGGSLSANQVYMTIVQTRPIFVRADVPEKDLQHVLRGVTGKAIPAALPMTRLSAIVDHVSPIPISAGTFDARIQVALENQEAEPLVPGMACKVKLPAYQKRDALTVPASMVFTDELDEDEHYVYVAGENGGHERRTVKVGQRTADTVEIRDGLEAGERILKKKP